MDGYTRYFELALSKSLLPSSTYLQNHGHLYQNDIMLEVTQIIF